VDFNGLTPSLYARLLHGDGRELMEGMAHVDLQAIDRGGILLRGFPDIGRSAHPVRQGWWCVPLE